MAFNMKTLLTPNHFFTVQVCSGGNGKGWTHIRWGSEYSSWSWHLQASCYSRYKYDWSIYANHFQWLLFWFHVCKVVLTEYLLSFHACDSRWFPYFRCKHAGSAMAWFGSCQ